MGDGLPGHHATRGRSACCDWKTHVPPLRNVLVAQKTHCPSPLRVKRRNTHCEQMFSASPPEADIRRAGSDVRVVQPIPDIQVHAAACAQMAQPKAGKMAKVTLGRRFRRGHAWQAIFTKLTEGCDHVTGQASFEAETHSQSRRREGARCRWTEFFAGG